MYNYNSIASDMEDLVMDFLLYRKSRNSQGVKAQSNIEAGKGWPSYESIQMPLIPEEKMPKNYDDYSDLNYSWRYPKFDETKRSPEPLKDSRKSILKDVKYPDHEESNDHYREDNLLYPKPEQFDFFYGENQKDMELMHSLHGDINAKLLPYVDEVLNSYEYEGSPLSADRVSQNTLNQVVDKVIDLSCKHVPEVNKIFEELERSDWCNKRLVRSCVEALVLCDLFGRRRPMYRCIFGSAYEYFK